MLTLRLPLAWFGISGTWARTVVKTAVYKSDIQKKDNGALPAI